MVYEVGLRPFYKGNIMDIQKCILNNGLGLSTLLFSIFQGFSETTAAATTRQARNADHGFSQALFSKAWILRSVS